MTGKRVQQLCQLISRLGTPTFNDEALFEATGVRDPSIAQFVLAYRDTKFAWNAMQRLVEARQPFPAWLTGKDAILFRAYCYLRNPRQFPDSAVRKACAFMTHAMRNDRAVLDGLLLAEGATIQMVSEVTGFSAEVIGLYEACFFNVLDRKTEAAYVRNLVYPEGRGVEMMEGYLKSEDFGMLLRRAGFNNGIGDVIYLAGFPGGLAAALGRGGDLPAKFESVLMANGYILARNGFSHQENVPSIRRAATLLAAAKAGGEQSGEINPTEGMGEILANELSAVSAQRRERNVTPQDAEPVVEAAPPLVVWKAPEKA